MPRTVEYKDPARLELIRELKESANKEDAAIWRTLAHELSRSGKNRREVNMWKLSKYTKDGETVVVPGKVLGDGELDHRINIAAYKFSEKQKRRSRRQAAR